MQIQSLPKAQFAPLFRPALKALPAPEPSSSVDQIALRTILGRDDVPRSQAADIVSVSREDFTKEFVGKIAEQKGDAPITFLSSPRPRRKQSHNIAEGFRLDQDMGLVLDPLELKVEGWDSKDYATHWADVRKAFSDDMQLVMGPGWEKSEISQRDFAHAKELGISVQQLQVKDLSRTDIEIRLAESEQELTQRGFSAPTFGAILNGAVDQNYLADKATGSFTTDESFTDPKGYVYDVVDRTLNGKDDVDNDGARQAGKMPQSEFTELYVEAAKEQLNGRPMTYVSTPITGGRKKYDLFEDLGITSKEEFDASGKNRFVKDVIVANTNRAYRISESLRDESGKAMVMDPSEITIPEWSQSHYAAHWDAVVEHLASKIVLAPGWDFSSGCILELKRALDKGVPVQEVVLAPVSTS